MTDISEQHVAYSNFSSSVHIPESDFFAVLRSHLVTNIVRVPNRPVDRTGRPDRYTGPVYTGTPPPVK